MNMKLVVGAVILIGAAVPAFATDNGAECDHLAASPSDVNAKAPAVAFNDIDGAKAEAACRASIADSADEPRFMFELGRALDRQDKFDEAKAAYLAAGEAGYGPGYHGYGKLFELGLGSDTDYAKAAAYYQKAIDAGMTYAAGDLAYLHEEGLGFDKDAAAAAPLYRRAAEAGDDWSQVHLGFLYEKGAGVARDHAEAMKWYSAAAEKGNSNATYNIALMYRDGEGVPKNNDKAVEFLKRSIDAGGTLAAKELARFFEYGAAGKTDLAEAERLYRIAIDKGEGDTVWQSQNELAWMIARSGNNRLDEAAAIISDALSKAPTGSPDYGPALDTKAWILHLQGKTEEALSIELQVIDLDPAFPPFFDRLGDFYAALGKTEEAKAAWRQALELTMDDINREPDWSRAAVEKKLGG